MKIVGLTGGAFCGKSTVLGIFGNLGAATLDADRVARGLVKKGRPEYRRIVGRYGRGILGPGGRIDRRRLREAAFADPRGLVFLEKVLHPGVKRVLAERCRAARARSGILVAEVPLLFEARMRRGMDATVAVTAPEKRRRQNAAARGFGADAVRKFSERQWPLRRKAALADHVIRNGGNLRELRCRVRRVWDLIRKGGVTGS